MKREIEVSGFCTLFMGLNLIACGEQGRRIFRIENAKDLENVASVYYKSRSGLTSKGNYEDDIFCEVELCRLCKDYKIELNLNYFEKFFYMRDEENLYLIRIEQPTEKEHNFYLQEIQKEGCYYYLKALNKEACKIAEYFMNDRNHKMNATSKEALKILRKILLNSSRNHIQKEDEYEMLNNKGLYEHTSGELFIKKGNYFFPITLKEARTNGILDIHITANNEIVFYYQSKVKSACHTIDLEWLRFAYADRDVVFKIENLEYMFYEKHLFLCEYPKELGDISKIEFLEDFNERNSTDYNEIVQVNQKGITLMHKERGCPFDIQEYFCLCDEQLI